LITESSCKAVYVWILGQFGNQIEDAPYILEKIIDEEAEMNHEELQTNLVIATTRLFFTRAPEMKNMLQKLYK
jgi:AP-4 complex subunit beta-1